MPGAKQAVPVDSALIRGCLDGDQDAWTQLIRRYERLVYSVARVVCPEDAGDVFQQVCLELYERLGELRDQAALPKWLITVTRRTCYAIVRSRKNQVPLTGDWGTVPREIDRVEKQHAIQLSLSRLPEKCQKLLRLLYHDELSYAQVASRLQIPVASIGPTRARCLGKLKQKLE
jgi:RNA polymerase sigma factor (sigma-70 family)